MTSHISWIDYSTKEREDSMRALALLKGPESRDELGIGAIRDSLSDLLFPGTSTLQTKLKYFLIIPWMYMSLEQKKIESDSFSRYADKLERDLIENLSKIENTEGVIGLVAGRSLKILPSTMYWSGLKNWGIFEMDKTKTEYFNLINYIYKERESYINAIKARSIRNDDWQENGASIEKTWNTKIPDAPKGFPETIDLDMYPQEADFIQERIIYTHKNSLLAFLAKNIIRSGADHPTAHELYDKFSDIHKKQVWTAYKFSLLVQGAALLYNLMLAELSGNEERINEYGAKIKDWEDEKIVIRDWDIEELWDMARYTESIHSIKQPTQNFVNNWLYLCIKTNIKDNLEARELVKEREKRLKRTKSRISNQHMLDKWGGNSGTGLIDNRWGIARRLLNDLYDGFERK